MELTTFQTLNIHTGAMSLDEVVDDAVKRWAATLSWGGLRLSDAECELLIHSLSRGLDKNLRAARLELDQNKPDHTNLPNVIAAMMEHFDTRHVVISEAVQIDASQHNVRLSREENGSVVITLVV